MKSSEQQLSLGCGETHLERVGTGQPGPRGGSLTALARMLGWLREPRRRPRAPQLGPDRHAGMDRHTGVDRHASMDRHTSVDRHAGMDRHVSQDLFCRKMQWGGGVFVTVFQGGFPLEKVTEKER